MDASIIITIVSVTGMALSLLLMGAGGLFWLWKLHSRVDHMEHRFDQLADQLQELREEVRRNHQQLLQALANHRHDENGQPTFRAPVGME